MNFLYPGFLFALFSIAIPIIIHLFNFRKFKKLHFSNVAFLKEIKIQNSSRERLKNLLILCCRILAILFLVFAFARPFLNANSQIDQSKGNIISIYIDNSYSMEALSADGSLLDEAKRKAKEIVKAYQINDRFQLLTNDFEGKHQRLLNREEFIQAVEELKISAASRSLQQVLNRQQSVFNGTDNRFAYIISDFQKGFAGNQPIKSDPDTHVSLISLKANELPNVAIDSVWSLSPVYRPNTTAQLVFRIKNYGNEDAKDIPIKLKINNQQKAIANVSVLAGKTLIDTLSYGGLSLGWQKGIISLKDFPITFDDALNFSFKVDFEQKILSINGLKSQNYIQALFQADPYFKLTEMPEGNINYAAFPAFSCIILYELDQPSSGLAAELKTYVQNGGTVIIFPHLTANTNVYSTFLNQLQLPAVNGLIARATNVNYIALKNPLFSGVFETLPKNLDLPEVNRYFSFAESNRQSKEDLLQLPGGRLFFARYPIAKGQVFLSASGLNDLDGNLAKHPVFVPLMYKTAFSSTKEHPLYAIVMKDQVLNHSLIQSGPNQSLKLVSEQFEIIPELRQSNGASLLYIDDQIKKAGFYELKQGDSTLAIFAFNENSLESDMHYDEQSDLSKILNKEQVSFVDASSKSVASAVAMKNNGTELWKLCLILSVIFLALEVVLVRFYHQKTLPTHEPLH